MLQLQPKPTASTSRASSESKQPRRLLLALVLLLVALAGVLWHDRDFWFGSEQSAMDSEASEPAVTPRTASKSAPSTPSHAQSAPATKKQIPAAKTSAEAKPADSPVVATIRTVLPPLDVEVVAGDAHRTLHPGSNATKVEITNPASAAPQSAAKFGIATDAAERERIAANQAQPSQATYPLLAQQMKVQGSVVLQALIGADGIIQNLRVLSGPSILTTAAQQAVREWRFKPIVQNGQPVESKAQITVNFTINIADGSAKTTLAESRPLTIESLTR